MARLLIVRGPNRGVSYELSDRTRMGRLGENEIQVADPNVSRIHAEIIKEGDDFILYDRGSKNGVAVNGEEVPEKKLEPGDEVAIGSVTFVYDPMVSVRNTRYSCTPIMYLPEGTDAEIIENPGNGKDQPEKQENSELAALCVSAPKSLPSTAIHICETIRSCFNASHVVLFLRDYPSAELYPIEAAPRQITVAVNMEVVNRCLELNAPVACKNSLDFDALKPYIDEQSAPERSNHQDKPTSVTMLCAPISCGRRVSGVLLLSFHGEIDFSSHTVAALQMAAVFAALTFQAARPPAPPPSSETAALDAEQRSASTRSLRMQEIYNSARRSASGNAPILITGERGTGKETLARFIHESGERADGPFIVVQCAAIAPDDLEKELFGEEQETDHGELIIRPGKIDEAVGGTLFLQEVGELDLAFQPKLLRFVQDSAYTRVNSGSAAMSDVKIIATSSIDLAAAVRSGNFREDLWYRLNVVPFHMPPLRERREDVAPLLDFFIQYYSVRFNKKIIGANDSAISLLQKYDWPGNIRELNNAVERAVLLAESKVLSTSDFAHIEEARRQLNAKSDLERKRDTRPLAEVERQHIIIALKKHNFNQARAAEALGLHRNTLRNKIIEYGIEIPK